MNTEQQQKFFQEAAAAAAEAASAASRPVMPPVTAANLAAAASNPYLAALAASTGNPTSAYLQPPLGSFPPPVSSAATGTADNSWLMSSLLQASIRQQWMSQLASIQAAGAAPFMNPLAASMASLGAGAFPSSLPPPRLPLLLPTNTTSTSKTGKENSSSKC